MSSAARRLVPTADGTATAGPAFRTDIEGLRGIAIILVVGYHAGLSWLSGGYVGVDVFFVLSGFLITGLLLREIAQTGTIHFATFYARRVRRLLPALALTLLVTIAVSAAIYPPFEANQGGFGATAVATAAYVSNLYFAATATDYFGPNKENNAFLHTWSLSVEEQFYLLWPLFVLFAVKMFFAKRNTATSYGRVACWMAAATVVSFAVSLYLTPRQQSWAYFSLPSRAWEFSLGALAVLVPGTVGRSLRNSAGSVLVWIGLAGVVVASVAFGRTTVFPGMAVLLPGLSTALLLWASTNHPGNSLTRILSVEPLQVIGRLSYSWYLWHWPVLVLGAAIIPTSLPMRLGLVLFSLGLSAMSYYFVENPIRQNRRLARRPIYSLAMAALLAATGIAAALAWRSSSIAATKDPDQVRFIQARGDGPKLTSDCSLNYFDVEVKPCSFGDPNGTQSVVVLGDSHAAQWFSVFESIAQRRGWRLVPMVKSACAMVDAEFYYSLLGRMYTECGVWRQKAIGKIREMRPILTVVSSSDGYAFTDAQWNEGISSVFRDLSQASQNVLVLRDTPSAEFDVPMCLARRLWRPSFVPTASCDFSQPPPSPVFEIQSRTAQKFKNVEVLDLTAEICPGGICRPERDNLILYRDSNHLTASFLNTLEGVISGRIDRVLNEQASGGRPPFDTALLRTGQ